MNQVTLDSFNKLIHKDKKHTKCIALVIGIVAVVAVSLIIVLNICNKAIADPIPHVGDPGPSGSCLINDTWMVGQQSYFHTSFYDGDLNKHAAETSWFCDDYTAAAPEHVGATFSSVVSEVYVREGYVVYNVYITPPGATDGKTRDPSGRLYGYQHVRGYLRVDKNFVGDISINKVSDNVDMTNGNALYTYNGATFNLYADEACSDLKGTFVTDGNGYAEIRNLPVGDYWVKEQNASDGYLVNSNKVKVTVEAGTMLNYKIDEPARHDPNFIMLHKRDSETKKAQVYGDATFEGAQYAFDYYDGLYTNYQQIADSGKTVTRSWVLKTDSQGRVSPILGDQYKVSGNNFYKKDGKVVCPLGTYLVYERATPSGYLLSNAKYIIQVYKDDSSPTGASSLAYDAETGDQLTTSYDSTYRVPYITDDEQIIRGGLQIEKRDLESKLLTCLGAGSFDGIKFDITNLSQHSVMVDNKEYSVGDVCASLIIQNGKAELNAKALPYGTYQIQEVKTTDSYLLTDSEPRIFQIRENGQIVQYTSDKAFYNQVKRGDYKFVKVSTPDMKPMANIPFKITSLATGEWHVIVTDANGQASTENIWNQHTHNTNINDKILDMDGKVPKTGIDQKQLISESGIWFGLTTEGATVPTQDSLCALPYDKYTLEELPVYGNEGHLLITREFSITRDGVVVDGGTIDDDPTDPPKIETIAKNKADNSKILDHAPSVIVDKVSYTNLTQGQNYRIEGQLYNLSTQTFIDGSLTDVAFTAETSSGFQLIEFNIDATTLASHRIVVFEKLYSSEGLLLCEHNNEDDELQTVSIKDKPAEPTPEPEKPAKTSVLAKTEDVTGLIVMGLLFSVILGFLYLLKRFDVV